MTADTKIEWIEHTRLTEDIATEEQAADLLQTLGQVFSDAKFCVSVYENSAWLLVGDNISKTRLYDIRRWLRENDYLNRFSDDDDDDRANWEIPEDYQPARQADPTP